jgi:hypothetical protein
MKQCSFEATIVHDTSAQPRVESPWVNIILLILWTTSNSFHPKQCSKNRHNTHLMRTAHGLDCLATFAARTGLLNLQARQSSALCHADLDSMTFIRNIDFSRNDLAVDLFGGADKGRLDIIRRLGRGFHKDQSIGFSKGLTFIRTDCPTMFQVIFITNQHDDHIRLGMLTSFLQPPRKVLKGIPAGNVVHQQSARRSSVIATRDTSEGFLTSRVPDLKFDELVVQVDHSSTKLNSNGQVVYRLETFVCKLQEQAGLSDTYSTCIGVEQGQVG